LLFFLLVAWSSSSFAQSPSKQEVIIDRDTWVRFVSDTAKGKRHDAPLRSGGSGPAVVLLHGFPEDWYEFHQNMPRLAKNYSHSG